MALRIYGTRAAARDPRLDFAFPARMKKAAALAKAKADAEKQKYEDEAAEKATMLNGNEGTGLAEGIGIDDNGFVSRVALARKGIR
jgi:hypothetical protein